MTNGTDHERLEKLSQSCEALTGALDVMLKREIEVIELARQVLRSRWLYIVGSVSATAAICAVAYTAIFQVGSTVEAGVREAQTKNELQAEYNQFEEEYSRDKQLYDTRMDMLRRQINRYKADRLPPVVFTEDDVKKEEDKK